MGWLKHTLNSFLSKLRTKLSLVIRERVVKNKTSIRSTVAGIEIGNFLVALSTTGMMALGVISLSLPVLIVLALIFVVLGVIGRYVDSVEDDVERLLKYENYLRESAAGSNPDSSSTPSVQQKDY